MATNIPVSQIINRFERNIDQAKRKAHLWSYDRIESLVKRLKKIKIKSIDVYNGVYTIYGDRVDAMLRGEKYNLPLTLAVTYYSNTSVISLIDYPKKDSELFEEIADIVNYCAKKDINLDMTF